MIKWCRRSAKDQSVSLILRRSPWLRYGRRLMLYHHVLYQFRKMCSHQEREPAITRIPTLSRPYVRNDLTWPLLLHKHGPCTQ